MVSELVTERDSGRTVLDDACLWRSGFGEPGEARECGRRGPAATEWGDECHAALLMTNTTGVPREAASSEHGY